MEGGSVDGLGRSCEEGIAIVREAEKTREKRVAKCIKSRMGIMIAGITDVASQSLG